MEDFPLNSFRKLSSVAKSISESSSIKRKIRICTEYLESIQSGDDLNLAVRFLFEGPLSITSEKKVTVGSRTIYTCVSRFCEIDYEQVFKPSKAAMGSAEETIEKLMDNIETACQKRRSTNLSLRQTEKIFKDLSVVSSRAEKQEILRQTWTKMTPLEIKYFVYLLRRRPLPVGLDKSDAVSAIACTFKNDPNQVKNALMISGSLAATATLSKANNLDGADFKLFHPRPFMNTLPFEDQTISDIKTYLIEENIDGIRCQVHIDREQVRLFTGKSNDITNHFPEVENLLDGIHRPMALDGILCAFKDERIFPFQLLQKRLKADRPSKRVLTETPALFIAFDLLYFNDQPFFQCDLSERRSVLETIASTHNLPITNSFKAADPDELDFLLERSIKRGNKGLILKKTGSTYKGGQRDESWLKVKSKRNTLSGVIMYAHTDSGDQRSKYTAFTLGVNVTDDERYDEDFIPIGKIPNTCSAAELEELDQKIQQLTAERYGPTFGLIPEIVVKAEFDRVKVNKRTKANHVLYKPRFKSINYDIPPANSATLKEVEQLFKAEINGTRLKQGANPSFIILGSK